MTSSSNEVWSIYSNDGVAFYAIYGFSDLGANLTSFHDIVGLGLMDIYIDNNGLYDANILPSKATERSWTTEVRLSP